jgi:hypothetical protein
MSSFGLILSHDDADHPFITTFPYAKGLQPLYEQIGCDLVEVAARGVIAGIAVTLLIDEEGLYKRPTYRNRAANDLAASLTGNPAYAHELPLVGHAVLVMDTGEDWRGFTAQELATVVAALEHDGHDCIVAKGA